MQAQKTVEITRALPETRSGSPDEIFKFKWKSAYKAVNDVIIRRAPCVLWVHAWIILVVGARQI